MSSSKKVCQYNYPSCQKVAEFQHIKKLGAVQIDKGWSCGNCKQYLEKSNYE